MPKPVTIAGTSFVLPQQGDSPPWGDELSSILEALISVANNVVGTGDILTTSFALANNISSVTNITGLSFDTSQVRSAIINYSIYRSTNSNELSECGIMIATYKSTANTWEFSQYSVGDSNVTITLTTSGQFQYTSSNLSGTSYSGKMKFSARAFLQA